MGRLYGYRKVSVCVESRCLKGRKRNEATCTAYEEQCFIHTQVLEEAYVASFDALKLLQCQQLRHFEVAIGDV